MTAKRYSKMMNHYGTSRTYCTGIYDNQNNRELQNSNQIITELNALYEENEELKERIKELQKESYGNLDGLNYYQEQNGHLSSKISDLECENEQLKQQLKQSVFVNLDGEEGCWNCKYCYGGFCEILKNTTVSWLKGVSNCNLKKWELEE